jgi:hypothetical protein
MTIWLKSLGHSGNPLPATWAQDGAEPDRLRRAYFPQRPRIDRGDRLVYYAAGWRRCFGVVEVISDGPSEDHPHPTEPVRWPWSVEVQPLLLVPDLRVAPPLEAIGVGPLSVRRKSHIRLSSEHYERAVDALASVAR